MTNPNQVTLRVSNQDWHGWKSFSLSRQVDAVCGEASFSLTNRWHHEMQPVALYEGLPCSVLIGNEEVLNGYIIDFNPSFSASNHEVSVTCYDKTIDMVHCAALHNSGHFLNLDALELAGRLAEPFGVNVEAALSVGEKFASFKLEPGETAFTALDRALRQRELLAAPDGAGNLVLKRIGQERCIDSLVEGLNVETASASFSQQNRFSHYVVQGQQPGNDLVFGEEAAFVEDEARDPNVLRYRPMLIRAENQVNQASALKRARWEASVRAARAAGLNITVSGWRQTSGALWPLGALVSVDCPSLYVSKQEMVISKLTYSLTSTQGSTTRLELKHKDAFTPEPVKAGVQVSAGASRAVQEISDEQYA